MRHGVDAAEMNAACESMDVRMASKPAPVWFVLLFR